MREKRSFAERTRVLPNDEVKKKYFLVYEGKDTEAIYFEAVDVLREHISINPLIEVIPVIRSYSEDGWSNPKKILDRMIKNIEELKSGEVSYETLLNWIMDYFHDYGILENNRPLAKSYWTTLQQICEEKLEVSLEEKVDNLQMACELIFDILKEESKLENIVADIPRIINNSVLTYSEEIDKICLIVDRDKDSFTSAQYDYVVEQCKNRNYGIYITNPCFEFWLLTYIKVRGIKAYIWFIMDAASRSIIGYQVSDNRSVGPCILAMRMAFQHFKELPKNFKFIADGYSAYPLAAMEFAKKFKDTFTFSITQVIGLTNDDEVSKEFRPYKQMIERLNRTYKASYRPTNGFDNYDGASYDLALWVAYYNFLRPHKHNNHQVLNKVNMLTGADNMPGKWQLLIFLGQQTILNLQAEDSNCS